MLTWLLLAGLSCQEVPPSAAAEADVAGRFLRAVIAGDGVAIRELADNDGLMGDEELSWLIGGAGVHPGGKPELSSARQVLGSGKVLTRLVATEQADGSTVVEAVYLPLRTADSFATLANAEQARNFRDYMMCEFIVRDGRASMRNTCFAETDVFDP